MLDGWQTNVAAALLAELAHHVRKSPVCDANAMPRMLLSAFSDAWSETGCLGPATAPVH